MSIKNVHPLYTDMLGVWSVGIDSYSGEDAIKNRGVGYLPPTSGQAADGQGTSDTLGDNAYKAYKLRAVYPDIYKEAVDAAIGIMHREPPMIELPAALEEMRGNATLLNESLELVLRKINARQLITGRLGILGDLRKDGAAVRPVIAIYNEGTVRNWDDTSVLDEDVDIRMVVLDESGYTLGEDFNWEHVERYRLLGLINNEGKLAQKGVYASLLTETQESDGTEILVAPSLLGQTLGQIPFAFINTKDLSPQPDLPPLYGLAKLCLAIYRGEADYRQNLFMQGQDTLVRIGAQGDDDVVRTGAGSRIDVPLGGDAKYVGVSSSGLSEQRSSLENDYVRALQKSGQFLSGSTGGKESGEALKIRVAAQTATLPQIAKTGAAGLEKVLKALAVWYGANPDEVKVTPNLNFTEADLKGDTLVQIMQAK